jgi:hypothetical protein
MAINHGDIIISTTYGAWPTTESISIRGYKAAGADFGLKISVRNNSNEVVLWCNVDIGLHHNSVVIRKAQFEDSTTKEISTVGTETFVVGFGSIEPGGTKESILPNQSRHSKESDSTNYTPLRCYGKTRNGDFIFHLAQGYFPPVSVTGKDRPYDDLKCFIAHAAFQDTNHPVVCELRKARDEILKNNRAGRRFIAFYYRHSPRIASIIARRPILRAASRAVLKPLSKASRYIRLARNTRNGSHHDPC